MTTSPRVGARLRPDLPFRYIGGTAALDLVNTVDWTRRGPDDERLTDYVRFTRFAEGADVIDGATGDRLRALARRQPRAASEALHRALAFRDALQRVLTAKTSPARARGREYDLALRALNVELHTALQHLGLRADGHQIALRWDGLGSALESPLWPIAWSAAQLLASEEQSRLRVCAGPDCGWVYVDRSRNRMRRWCQMETCGNRAKASRRYSRVRRAPDSS